MNHPLKVIAIALCLALPGWTMAADDNPDDEAAHIRHALMELMGWNMKTVAGMSTDKMPYDQASAVEHGERLAALGRMIADAFARDTSGAELGRPTQALDAIWQNQADFKMKGEKLVETATAYAAAAGESEAAAKKAFIMVGGSCKGCHEDYKSE